VKPFSIKTVLYVISLILYILYYSTEKNQKERINEQSLPFQVPSTAKGGGGIMASDEKHICAMCGYPGAKHSGGYRKPNGTIGEEWFCSESHFNLWLKWRAAFSPVSAQKRIFQYKEAA